MSAAPSDATPLIVADRTRNAALSFLVLGIVAIAVAYAASFVNGGAPVWAAWLLALGLPFVTGAIMVLGATRGNRGVGSLKAPFVFVVIILALGFAAALALPARESVDSALWLGLPARAAIVVYGIGLLPIVILPVAYAVTFESQTLSAADIERVRDLARQLESESANSSSVISGGAPK